MNGTMLQGFSWYLPSDGSHWCRIAEQAADFAYQGITAVWLPPAYKAEKGAEDVGYGVYDTYDLGEFDQKGTVRTKYGTRAEYEAAVRALQDNGIQALADIVLNQRLGADGCEDVVAREVQSNNRGRPRGAVQQPRGCARGRTDHLRVDALLVPRSRGQVLGLHLGLDLLPWRGLGRSRQAQGHLPL